VIRKERSVNSLSRGLPERFLDLKKKKWAGKVDMKKPLEQSTYEISEKKSRV